MKKSHNQSDIVKLGKRTAIYSRVSTEGQDLEVQKAALRTYCANSGLEIVLEIEEKASGGRDTRPGREQIMKTARRREIDIVVVWKLDRWGRSLRDLVMCLAEFQEIGIGFISLTEAIDLTTPSGRMMAGFLAVFAQFEREMIRERTIEGLAYAKSRGVKLGPKFTAREPFKIWKTKQLRNEGLKYSEIAKELKISKSSVCRILKGVEL